MLDLNDSSWFAWLFGHHTSPEKLRDDMAAAGYRLTAEHDFVAEQTFMVFAPEDDPDALPTPAPRSNAAGRGRGRRIYDRA